MDIRDERALQAVKKMFMAACGLYFFSTSYEVKTKKRERRARRGARINKIKI